MFTLPLASKPLARIALAGACAISVGMSTASLAQDFGISAPQTTDSPLQRGLGETLRSGVQGGSVGDALRRGVGEAAQSAIESPGQTAQRDQFRTQQQLDAQQRAQLGAPQGGSLYQDQQGRSYYLDSQGTRVYSQQQAYGQQPRYSSQPGYSPQPSLAQPQVGAQTQSTAQGQIASRGQTSDRQRPTLGVAIESAEQGVRVTDVRPGSAAEQAGLQRGDIIQSVNGMNITSPQVLVQSISSSAGGQAELTVIRNGQSEQMTAMLSDADSSYRVAKPAMESGGMAEQFSKLQLQLSELQKDFDSLRQEVMALKTPQADTHLLDNTSPTEVNDSPAAPSPAAPADESPADLFNDSAADNGGTGSN